MSFIFLRLIVHHHSDLKVPCSNLTIDKTILFAETHTLE
jgi:hypothetical protein